MDGLLIDSEDKVGDTINEILAKYGRPPLTPETRCQLMGVSDSSNSDLFHCWAQLPIPRAQCAHESHDLISLQQQRMELAVASTSTVASYERKMTQPESAALLALFPQNRRVLSDKPRVPQHKKKPAPDVYNIALAVIDTRRGDTPAIEPGECLAFEDSVADVEAARRAGMRVVWVPHPVLLSETDETARSRILAGRSGMFDPGKEHQLGQMNDGRG